MKLKVFYFLITSLLLGLNFQLFAQRKDNPKITKKIGYLKTRDYQLETALRSWSKGSSDEEIYYFYNTVDLNGDKKNDALVFVAGNYFCGTGGCVFLIFKGTSKGFQLVTEMSVSRPPIIAANQKTNGWKDLIMLVYGGGIRQFYSHLKFNGKTYPKNPTTVRSLKTRITGVEYLSGIENYKSGFLLK